MEFLSVKTENGLIDATDERVDGRAAELSPRGRDGREGFGGGWQGEGGRRGVELALCFSTAVIFHIMTAARSPTAVFGRERLHSSRWDELIVHWLATPGTGRQRIETKSPFENETEYLHSFRFRSLGRCESSKTGRRSSSPAGIRRRTETGSRVPPRPQTEIYDPLHHHDNSAPPPPARSESQRLKVPEGPVPNLCHRQY